jgi:hypothetical protein
LADLCNSPYSLLLLVLEVLLHFINPLRIAFANRISFWQVPRSLQDPYLVEVSATKCSNSVWDNKVDNSGQLRKRVTEPSLSHLGAKETFRFWLCSEQNVRSHFRNCGLSLSKQSSDFFVINILSLVRPQISAQRVIQRKTSQFFHSCSGWLLCALWLHRAVPYGLQSHPFPSKAYHSDAQQNPSRGFSR